MIARFYHWIKCLFGRHSGICLNGSFRCKHCQYTYPYSQNNKPT